MIENPPSFVVRTELHKAAFDNGFRIDLGLDSGWLHFRSTTARGDIWLGAGSKDGPWLLAVGLAAVAHRTRNPASRAPSPGSERTGRNREFVQRDR